VPVSSGSVRILAFHLTRSLFDNYCARFLVLSEAASKAQKRHSGLPQEIHDVDRRHSSTSFDHYE